jgi:hypothetical protein
VQFEIRGDWREDLGSFARGLQATILRHPWMAIEGAGRTSLGPNTAQCFERILGAIAGLGLTIDEMLSMIETLDAFIRGRALEELADQEAIRRSGLNNEQWMSIQAPYVESLIGSGRYPLLSRIVLHAHGPHDPDRLKRGFELGLELVLNGLATMLPDSDPRRQRGRRRPIETDSQVDSHPRSRRERPLLAA